MSNLNPRNEDNLVVKAIVVVIFFYGLWELADLLALLWKGRYCAP